MKYRITELWIAHAKVRLKDKVCLLNAHLQFLLHPGIADYQLILLFFQVWPLLGHHYTQQLIFQSTMITLACNYVRV